MFFARVRPIARGSRLGRDRAIHPSGLRLPINISGDLCAPAGDP
jgi:hypothetical protein